MAVPFHWLVRDALAATHHLQLKITELSPPAAGAAATIVTGEVVRVFRGPLAPGAVVKLAVHALRDGESPPPSGILWHRWEALEAATVIEAWADDDHDGALRVAGSQCSLLDAPSDAPRHPLSEEDAKPPPAFVRHQRQSAASAATAAFAFLIVVLAIIGGLGVAIMALLR